MIKTLTEHAKKYPLMQPTDAVKLIYQATFGGGHLIKNETTVLDYLRTEYLSAEHRDTPLQTESLGETSRIYLDSILNDTELEIIAKIFSASAKRYSHGYDSADEQTKAIFTERLSQLKSLCRDGHFCFTPEELNEYLDEYSAALYPPVSHSEEYRTAYKPSYRVIDSRFVPLFDAIKAIAVRMRTNERVIVAIDGHCASGKTTAAGLISDILGGEVIHMDDFFLVSELRTAKRLTTPGGNIHSERFIDEVIPHLRDTDGFSYRKFECSRMAYADEPCHIEKCGLIICEGSYSLHPSFGEYYDIALFFDVSPDEQIKRIRRRDGEYMLSRFINEWIPMENSYFKVFDIKTKCDFSI